MIIKRRIRKMKKTIAIFVLLALFSLVFVSCFNQQSDEAITDTDQTASSTWNVEDVSGTTDYSEIVSSSVLVERKPLRSKLFASGTINGQKEAFIRSNTAGTIESIDFELGQSVEKGAVLVHLNNTIANLNYDQVEKQVENSRKQLEANEKLYERGAISLSQLNVSKSSLSGLEAQLKRAKESLNDVTISSVIKGRVAEKDSSLLIGDSIRVGQIIGKIVDTDTLRLTLSVGQSQVFLIKEGYEAIITIATPQKVYTVDGVVKAISAGSDARTGSWTVLVDFDNPDPSIIPSGVTAEVSIINKDAIKHLIVPNAAMVYRNNKTYVYRVDASSNVKLLEVGIVDTYGDYTAVETSDPDEVLENEKVLVSGLNSVKDGDAVVAEN
ncbi:MAG: efflux RND transporter periplasmic adaptor subunit [Spirochaetia bacterium]|nr:efflux RND transporter periplasmic adaptor subunit [Spirochaetia bacterium]